jgi:hypothetical protein
MKGVCSTYPNPDLWFPEQPQGKPSRAGTAKMVSQVNLAVSMCNRCPVKAECLIEGMREENIEHGIWGGMLAGERIILADVPTNNSTRRDAIVFAEGIRRWQELSLG